MKTKFFILTVSLFAFFGKANAQYCTNTTRYTEQSLYLETDVAINYNITFATAIDYQGKSTPMQMDIYSPKVSVDTSPKRPFIMMIHGGSFTGGDKLSSDIPDLCMHLAMRGFVTASLNYRLGKDESEYGGYKARYRAIQDGHAALRYVVNNANALRIDTSWIFVGGQSAGAALSLGLVYADPVELDSISLLYSPTAISAELGNLHTSGNNLTNKYSIKGIFNNWGGVIDSEVDSDELIPTISFHGERDTVVLIDANNSFEHIILNGSRAIHNKLIANNICSELNVVPNGGHGVYTKALSIHRAERASCFFKSIFCGRCQPFSTTAKVKATCSNSLTSEVNILGSIPKVYPNPVKNSFKIEGIDGALDLSIYNCYGQLVYRNEIYNGEVQINLLPGIYFLTVKQVETNKSFTTKLIKK